MLCGGSGGSVEVSGCVTPALESICETRIKRQTSYRIISFRIRIGLNPFYAYADAEVKKLKDRRFTRRMLKKSLRAGCSKTLRYKAPILAKSDE
jgi:hypothetical protein